MPNIFRSPDLFLSHFDSLAGAVLGLGEAQFIRIDQAKLRELAFLDHRELRLPVVLSLPLDELCIQAASAASQHSFRMIYHSAFCCSTYLARCLEATGVGRTLKEPYALTQLSFYHADESFEQFEHPADWEQLLRGAVDFLSRPPESSVLPIIKSHNFSIILAPAIARLFSGRLRSLFIYSDLRSFLVSTLKSRERRDFVHMLLKLMSPAKADRLGIPAHDPAGMTDGVAAAYCWLLHMACYEAAANQAGRSGMRSLDCQLLLEQPLETITSIAEYLGRDVPRDRLLAGLEDEGLKQHAKNPGQAFSGERRKAELQTQGFRFRKEVAEATRWFDALPLKDSLRGPASLPLIN